MQVTATHLRKHLFQILEQAGTGETVTIAWKGMKLRLVSPEGGSKLSRSVRRHALLVPPESIVESDAGLMSELEAKWHEDDLAIG